MLKQEWENGIDDNDNTYIQKFIFILGLIGLKTWEFAILMHSWEGRGYFSIRMSILGLISFKTTEYLEKLTFHQFHM